MRRRVWVLFGLAAAGSLGGCASDGARPVHERGWIGGEFVPVERVGDLVLLARDEVYGMPTDVTADSGLLVGDAGVATPLARAGVVAGDLVLSADGAPIEEALDLARHVDEKAPGATTRLVVWRDGATHDVDVTVGRETYERVGMFTIFLGVTPHVDLWPFNGDMDVLGVLGFKIDSRRPPVPQVAADYLRRTQPEWNGELPLQEESSFRLMPIGFGRHHRVLTQTAWE